MLNSFKKDIFIFAVGVFFISAAFAQQTPKKNLSLKDMSAFKPQAGNWFVVKNVTMNQAVIYEPGSGILLNMKEGAKNDNLITNWEHGDIELELEVMLPKGSNSGIYLQGRYELQLFDSWGVKSAKFTDIGGIYREGGAPLTNAAKAPGLWQSMKISFRAPRFNQAGEKIANARFVSVELNGVKIQDNVEVPSPTGGAIENNEKPMGPLMIQGDHGQVALRNIKYRLMQESKVSVSNITYKAYKGEFGDKWEFVKIADFVSANKVSTGKIPEITWEAAGTDDGFGIIFNGNITVPEDGTYQFQLIYNGGAKLVINGQPLIDEQRPNQRARISNGTVNLNKGTYPFELSYYKIAKWMPPRLGFYNVDADPKALHAFNSFPPAVISGEHSDIVSPIYVKVGREPKLFRTFLNYKNDHRKELTHTIAVGDPCGINYIYDMKAGNLVCVWSGDFVDATPMWTGRGEGYCLPVGMVQYLSLTSPLANLPDQNVAFPEYSSEKDFRGKGYELEEATGRPLFKYLYKGMEVEDKIYPDETNKMIIREILVKNSTENKGLYFKLAEGKYLKQLPDGTYIMGDKEFYIKILSSSKPIIREVNGKKELVAMANGQPIKYSIIW